MYKLIISFQGDSDFEAIINYTSQTYGERQAILYAEVIQQEFMAISEMPTIGHIRKDMPSRYRARNAGQHVIVFEISEENGMVNILRILHTQMDFSSKF